MRELRVVKSFRKDMKKLSENEIEKTKVVVKQLQADIPLEPKYRDHQLHGNYEGWSECHVEPDLLLVYKKGEDDNTLYLALLRISSHTNIFSVKKSF